MKADRSVHSDRVHEWCSEAASACYHVEAWGGDYFRVTPDGQVEVTPQGPSGSPIGLYDLVEDLRRRGCNLPVLVRFSEILGHRLHGLASAFGQAISQYGYQGGYRPVFPIKVNQQRDILEDLLPYGREVQMGLEVGSKPELLVALAYHDEPGGLIVCNGYKDRAYIETVLLAQQLGRDPILVIDRFEELDTVLEVAQGLGVTPSIGVRSRLCAKGAGRWNESGGSRSKFGLSASEIVQVVGRLQAAGQLETLKLLHFHIGSQVAEIRAIKTALREATRIFVELCRMGASPAFIDVGGGLGVDYDGSRSSTDSSTNYSLQEYANDVVAEIQQVCDAAGIPHPGIISESGRAIAAHHSVLLFDVLGATQIQLSSKPDEVREDDVACIRELHEAWENTDAEHCIETYHDAVQAHEEALSLFNLGYLDLTTRARAEDLFRAVCLRVRRYMAAMEPQPEEQADLDRILSDTYVCNFSIFQSVPDSWAVDQLFPVMPIHRLNEQPTRRGTLADLTCDSDGKVHRFITPEGEKHALELHPPDGRPYVLGMFLVGAYQETLGDLHNLFGDTHAVHVRLDGQAGYRIERVVEGDTVRDVLGYVRYDRRDLMRKVREAGDRALRRRALTAEQVQKLLLRFEEGLTDYTYLDPNCLESRLFPHVTDEVQGQYP